MLRTISLASFAVAALALGPSCNALFAFAPDQICETQVRALCKFAYSCCDATERLVLTNVGNFRNEGECIQELLEEGGGNCANSFQVQEAVQQNRFVYDQVLAETCLKPGIDALNNCQAAAFDPNALELDPACEEIDGFAFGTPKVADGGACFAAFECITPGSLCQVNDEEDRELDEATQVLVTAVGTCVPPAKVDEDCSESLTDGEGTDGNCEVGTFCDPNEDFTCQTLKANGDDCVADIECETGFCNFVDDAVAPECDDLLDDGDECFENNDCLSELCLPDEDGDLVCTAQPEVVVEACNGLQANDAQF